MRFTKMHGLGNDYVFLDAFEDSSLAQRDDLPDLARAMSDRHRGVGADGLILVEPPAAPGAHARMRIYHRDGSDGERCGNGLRCVVKLLVERGRAPTGGLRVETTTGAVLNARAHTGADGRVDLVSVDMGPPSFDAASLPCDLGDLQLDAADPARVTIEGMDAVLVSVGNPHVVAFLDVPLEGVDLTDLGPRVERHRAFPRGVNLQIARVRAPGAVQVRTWERGAGMTNACGTGACAVLAAGVRLGILARDATITLPGGDLRVRWDERTNRIEQTGPAVEVFTGEWLLDNSQI